MNQEETHRLWQLGKEAWNEWAENILNERELMKQRGVWKVNVDAAGREEATNEETKQWFSEAQVIFSSLEKPHSFPNDVDFGGVVFPSYSTWVAANFLGKVVFDCATFEADASFKHATFRKQARFGAASFEENVEFSNATFHESAWFEQSNFRKIMWCEYATFEGIAWFDQTNFGKSSWFTQTTFIGTARFSSVTFKDIAWFHQTIFQGHAYFHEAHFLGIADFNSAIFKGSSGFSNSTFEMESNFSNVLFEQNAWFREVIFIEETSFSSSVFAKLTNFSKASFRSTASFNSVQIKQGFDVTGATFSKVPDFRQAHCAEAPLLDDIRIPSSISMSVRHEKSPNYEIPANYRALKRLAIQGHDHEHEVEFFAEELKARRLMVDKPNTASWWLSFLFEELSDYGRSMAKPLIYWVGLVMLSALLYIASAIPLDADRAQQCVAGAGSQANTAYQLAFAKGLLVSGLADRTIVTQAYDCLYGDIIPGTATVVAGIQTLLSAILLFLLLLGIRNRFKLK